MSRKTAGLVVLLSLLVALFAFPVFAQAAPGSVVGTVTAGGSAVPSITVTLYERVYNVEEDWYYYDQIDQTLSTSSGAYSFTGVPEDREYQVRTDDNEYFKYYIKRTNLFSVSSEETVVVPVALVLDTDAPHVNWSGDNSDSKNFAADDVVGWIQAHDYAWDANDDYLGGNAASILYSVNGGPSVLATQTGGRDFMEARVPTFTIEGVSVITFSAKDHAGNASKTRTQLIYIDKSAPVTGYDMKAATGSSIMLVSSDSGAGVAATYWRIGGTGAFTQGNLVPVPATGVAALEFYSVDKAGNVEAVKSMAIQSRAGLTKPKASTASPKAGKTFYVRGAVVGKTAATGTLRVYKLVNGKYKYVAKKSFKESSAGSYKVAFKLKKGTYKFKAFYGANTATASNPPASSVFSARSVVK